ncbi:DUF1003 domain-containing protein [Nocardia alni]|uniref:DUF1003 domain-containing protein n=1 Tax=Nocardia alni TaxID=2815723 RepID=UPI001C221940|nr:DUF1003 domain-containing protein [Nocardia alni]
MEFRKTGTLVTIVVEPGIELEVDQEDGTPVGPTILADERIGVNDAIAAALTKCIGSMPALYVVLVIFGAWMTGTTWWGPLHRLDPYPFPFLLFLDNVIQLVLCLVIMVGQRVLGAAADRRAVQTYENAEEIFRQVADLQAHLDRHDEALSRGVSLLDSSPHPWIERHRVQSPPQARDEVVTTNQRIAAWLTGRLSSVWAFYIAAATQVVWVLSAELGLQHFDRYPFAFMSFLSTLAQLLFMIVIMVGQDVLGRSGDRRSEQTYLDAEAILYECRRMKARLAAQDRIIESLAGYTNSTAAEQLARAIHADPALSRYHAHAHVAAQGEHGNRHRAVWEELAEDTRQSYRTRALRMGEDLAAIGCVMVPAFDPTASAVLTEDETHALARRDYERWPEKYVNRPGEIESVADSGQSAERIVVALDRDDDPAGASAGSARPSWDQLPEQARAIGVAAARRIPVILARAGFQMVRDSRSVDGGVSEADFTSQEWATLQRALVSAGVLVALAEGLADAEEMFALMKKLRETAITHRSRFIRELTGAFTVGTGVRPDIGYADYEPGALAAIRSATAIIARTAPAEALAFRALLTDIAETVGDANLEGGFFGLGAQRRYGNELTAIAAVYEAAGGEDRKGSGGGSFGDTGSSEGDGDRNSPGPGDLR